MKILDDVTNEIIDDEVAVKITFHCYDLNRHCLTVEGKEEPNNFQAKTLFVSKTTASSILARCAPTHRYSLARKIKVANNES